LAFLPGGSQLVSASADQTIVLYNLRTGTISGRLRGHETEIWALAVPEDGKSLITGAGYGGAVLSWPLQSIIKRSAPESGLVVRTLEDGRLLRYMPGARDYERYDVASGKAELAGMERLGDLVRRPIYPSDFRSLAPGWVVVSPDARRTVSNSGEKLAVTVLNSYTGEREHVISNKFGQVMHASFSDDGALLALFGRDSEVRLFRTADWTGQAVTEPLNGRAQAVFTPGSRKLLIATERAGVFVLDLPSKNIAVRFESSKLSWTSVAFSSDAEYFALGGQDNLIRIYDLKNGKVLPPLAGHAAGVWGLAFSPDNRTLASAGDKRIKLWSVDTWQEFFTLHSGERNPHGLSFSTDGRYLISYAPFGVWEAPFLAEIDALSSQGL
jgi:WD40 repeat protein